MNGTAKHPGKLHVGTPSDREIAMTRVFDAQASEVRDAVLKSPMESGLDRARLLSSPDWWSVSV